MIWALLDLGILLAVAGPGDRMAMGQLAGIFGVDPSVITYRMKRMEGMGYATRAGCATNRRVVSAESTAAGRAALERARRAMLDSARRNFFALVEPAHLPVLAAAFTGLQSRQRHPDGTTAPLLPHRHEHGDG